MSQPDDINVVTGASVAPEEWSSSALDWEDPFGVRALGEPEAKKPHVVFPPTHTAEVQQHAGQAVDTITVDSTPDQDKAKDHISPEHFEVFTPRGSGSQRLPPLQLPAGGLAERPDAGGLQQGGIQSTTTQGQGYYAYNGLERDLLSQANAQAYGVDMAAPPTWADENHQLQMSTMQNRIAQLQAANDQQAAEQRARDEELEQLRTHTHGVHQEYQAAYSLQQQQGAHMIQQHRIAADQAAAEQLRVQQNHSVELQRRLKSERSQMSLDNQRHHDAIVAREQSLKDRELQFKAQSEAYVADAKRHVDTYVAEKR